MPMASMIMRIRRVGLRYFRLLYGVREFPRRVSFHFFDLFWSSLRISFCMCDTSSLTLSSIKSRYLPKHYPDLSAMLYSFFFHIIFLSLHVPFLSFHSCCHTRNFSRGGIHHFSQFRHGWHRDCKTKQSYSFSFPGMDERPETSSIFFTLSICLSDAATALSMFA